VARTFGLRVWRSRLTTRRGLVAERLWIYLFEDSGSFLVDPATGDICEALMVVGTAVT
jgi:hypothetical protein